MYKRQVEEIQAIIGCDALIYQDVDAMKKVLRELNPKLSGFDASCFDGIYVTGDVNAADIARINDNRVQVSLDDEASIDAKA